MLDTPASIAASTPTQSQSGDFGLDETMTSQSPITSQTLRDARQELYDISIDEDIDNSEPIFQAPSSRNDNARSLNQQHQQSPKHNNDKKKAGSSKSKLRSSTTKGKEDGSESPVSDMQLVLLNAAEQAPEDMSVQRTM